jgi:hypothetical protein
MGFNVSCSILVALTRPINLRTIIFPITDEIDCEGGWVWRQDLESMNAICFGVALSGQCKTLIQPKISFIKHQKLITNAMLTVQQHRVI